MKQETKIRIFGVLMAISSISYMGCYIVDNELKNKPVSHEPASTFYNGEILMPDYCHNDTLVVINAKLLNDEIGNCDGSDGSYSDLLGEGCVTLVDYNSYMDLAGNGKK